MKTWPVRLRLALMFGVVFLGLGLVVLGVNFLMIRSALSPRLERLASEGVASIERAPRSAHSETLATRIDSITTQTILSRSAIALGGAAVLAGVVAWWLAGRSLQPVRQITSVTKRLSDRTLHERIELGGPDDEFKALADTIDGMLDRLDRAFDAQRRFVANASHELRTPWTLARTALDVYAGKTGRGLADAEAAMAKVRDSVVRSEALLDSLLALARAERLQRVESIDLEALMSRVCRERGVEAFYRSDQTPAIDGDPVLVEHLVANLVDNAVRHGDGKHLRIESRGGDRSAVVVVENSGPCIPATRVTELLEPFVRLDQDRTHRSGGSGLGLSIVKAIVDTHGWQMRAQPLSEGGLLVEVRIATASRS